MPSKAELVHRAIQNKLTELTKLEGESLPNGLYPLESYQLQFLRSIEDWYDDEADLKNMKRAMLELLKLFEPLNLD